MKYLCLLLITGGPLLESAVALAGERNVIPLTRNWLIRQLEGHRHDAAALTREAARPGEKWLRTRMPAQVHEVLLEAGKISDPRVGKNAADSAWVGERDWAYACSFPTPAARGGPVLLRFDGIDTLATAYLGGVEIGRFDNMYRRYTLDIGDRLAPPGEENVLLLIFSSPIRFLQGVKNPPPGIPRHKFLRKCHSDFGSYLGARPHSIKVGVFRPVCLDLAGPSRLEDIWVRADVERDLSRAAVRARVEAPGEPSRIEWVLVDPRGRAIGRGETAVKEHIGEIEVAVESPELWWPRTHGKAPLYRLDCSLYHQGIRVDKRAVSFGIRRIQPVLRDPKTGDHRFRFDINGMPIFLRGACWAPLEGITHCWNEERAARLLDLLEHGRMNVLRIWGEGNIPPPSFYEECDRRGILLWQDFMFGYGMHPAGDPAFDANCRAELEDMIRRLRNHPSILLWCGGNENHMGWNFRHGTKPAVGGELFGKVMPEVCARLDPGRLFHPSSPHGGRVPNWPLEGDWHDYTTLKFCPQASVPLYASEIGRVSAPSLESMRRFLPRQEDLWPEGHDPRIRAPGKAAWPPLWQYRSVGGSWDKVGALEQHCDPVTPEDLIRVLGTAHGEYLRDRVERQRRGVPDGAPGGNRRCWGNMVWRLNDSWPIIYWSVIDYYLEPKIAYYFLRRAYEPVLISFERTPDKISVWVVNDSPRPASGSLAVRRRRFDGRTLGEVQAQVNVAPGEARRILETTDLGPVVMRSEFLHASFAGREATCLLIGERYLHLPPARLETRRVADRIELTTDNFAYQVFLEMPGVTGAVFEDNFFNLPPGGKRSIRLVDPAGGTSVRIGALNSQSQILTTGN